MQPALAQVVLHVEPSSRALEHSDVEIAWLRLVLGRLTQRGLVSAIEEFARTST